MRIICISDTHEMHEQVAIPEGDLLVHAGDMTMQGDFRLIREFNDWCGRLIAAGRVKDIVCIAGNHEFSFQYEPKRARPAMTHCKYLEDSGTEVMGWKVYGTPWQPWFYDWAFNLKTEEELKEKFDRIPEDIDILICHSPPKGILDHTRRGEAAGSSALLDRIRRVRPRLVVFGHIHEGYGRVDQDGIVYVNASICNFRYEPVHNPLVIDLDR